MHSIYDPQEENWSSLLTTVQAGGGDGQHFEGFPFQRGDGLGTFLRGIFRYLLPLTKSAGSTLGQEGLESANRFISGILGGEPVGEVAKREGKTAVRNLLRKGAAAMEGQGRRRKRAVKIKALGGPRPRDIFST